jgi:hypothetical protein
METVFSIWSAQSGYKEVVGWQSSSLAMDLMTNYDK